jgi:hypothetical protein
MITSLGLCDINRVAIPRLEFPSFQYFLSKFPKLGVGVNSVIYKGILGKILEFLGQIVAGQPHFLATRPAHGPFLTHSFLLHSTC